LDRTYQPSTGSTRGATKGPGSGRGDLPLTFAGFRLEADGSLFRGDSLIHLPPRELAALQLLLAHAGQIVTPAQLKHALWGDVHVTADSVPKCLSSLRARLQPEDCIQTLYKRGYRLMAEVRPVGAATAPVLPRLAIPPFVADAGVPVHLGAAIAEETIARLSNAPIPLASILARDSVFTLAARGLTAQQIGEALNADLVLAGTLRALASHFRLRVEMILVANGVQIWVEDLLVERSRITELESDLASRLYFRLKSRSEDSSQGRNQPSSETAPPTEGAGGAPTSGGTPTLTSLTGQGSGVSGHVTILKGSPAPTSPAGSHPLAFSISAAAATPDSNPESQRREAYEMLLRGRHECQTFERHRMQDGLRHLTRAIELDPDLIAAKVELVHQCVTQALFGFMTPAAAANLVIRTAESVSDFSRQADAMLPALAWAHLHFNRNLQAALWALELSTHLPHDAGITRVRAMFALSRHHFPEAIAALRAAIQLDPFSPWLHYRLAWALHLAGQASESVELVEQASRDFPGHEGTAIYGATILAFNGDPERGIKLAQDLSHRQPYFDLAAAVHAYTLACAGRTGDACAILDRLQWFSRERFVLRSFIPAVYVALGNLDAALAELNAANDSRCPWFFQMLADPRLRPLKGRPEFKELQSILTRMEDEARLEAAAQN
jgi:DNA-binding winged helix-turn-helix (wHTH) protein/tetratricopeptide (TPR) repeat protein